MKLFTTIALLCLTAQGVMAQMVTTETELNAAVNGENTNANITLGNDITLENYLKIAQDKIITLDLNGHSLKLNRYDVIADGHVIEVFRGGTLTVRDSSGNNSGMISGGRANNGGGICNYGTLTFEGGTITNCYAAVTGGGIKNNADATLTMSGGVILGCYGTDCGGIYNAEGGTMNITGGTISGNTSNAGGGGVVNYGTATISGATIHNNHATTRGGGIWNGGTLTLADVTIIDNRADIEGGGITNYGTVSLHGGSINGNACQTDGGGIWNGGTLNIDGNITVTNNKMGNDLNSNLYCTNGHVIHVTGNLGSSTISVSREGNDGIVTSGLDGNGNIQNFENDFPQLSTIELANGEVKLSVRSNLIHYVEYSWDAANKKTISTIKTVDASECFFLDSTDKTTDYTTFTNLSPYIVVRGTGIKYNYLHLNIPAKLILCDGADITMRRLYVNNKVQIYGQIYETAKLTGNICLKNSTVLEIHGGNIDAYPTKVSGKKQDSDWKQYAGIGSYYDEYGFYTGGTIRIFNGNINAQGGSDAAGIGGGGHNYEDNSGEFPAESPRKRYRRSPSYPPSDGGIISIYGGTIEATGGGGAGIGGGQDGSGGYISIYGGYIKATGGSTTVACAGIGGGGEGSGGTITISGGHVEAYGGNGSTYSAAGIGGGGNNSGGNITITGGTVYAYGGNDAAGIGSGEEGILHNYDGGYITITGGTVYAYGNDEGAAIGAGQDAASGNIKILGGYVHAQGGENTKAICSHDTSDGNNSFEIGDQMMVSVNDIPSDVQINGLHPSFDGRILAMATNRIVTIQPCTNKDASYTIVDADIHKMSCKYCLSKQAAHTFGSYSECAACGLVGLKDNADNSSAINHWNGKTKTVALRGSTLHKDGTWNTICLPFSVNNLTGTPFAGATVKTLSTATYNNGTLSLNFDDAPAIAAGTPYIIKWADTEGNISSPMFNNVTITNTEPTDITGDAVNFHGIYAPYVPDVQDRTMLYLEGDNKLYYPNDNNINIGAFRAFFTLKGFKAGIPTNPQSSKMPADDK